MLTLFLSHLDFQTHSEDYLLKGTFNAAFIPSYAEEKLRGDEQGKKFADEVFNLLLYALIVLIVIVEIFTPSSSLFGCTWFF